MDSNRPEGWRVIDTNEPRAIVGTYDSYEAALSFCKGLEADPSGSQGHWRFILEPVRHV